ncbi:DNA circularization N-terminal domain-containing protein [Ancylobacter defluvii]|uniref:Tail protein n=1 Tax=Ancylobacter defluvii TaxID=1282440 RepID=A0A9W6JYV5_9HYPH|nr:DNA circularization N-terminal domain-containing protein [Ancylobacter defluvii]MBS7586401.1 DNA circularization N-terminal domain-containing protein [Ancylobacter defluvii]GLK85682.1 tail protein [Ancylobacter defluvii]
MGLFDDAFDHLPGLLPAMFRGVPFFMPDSDHEAGRRLLLTYFPGIDAPGLDDFGRAPGVIHVTGVYVGEDYVVRALALQAAFEAPGIATLLHPWLGEMSVVAEQPAVIRFSDRALGLITFDATLTPVRTSLAPVVSTLAGLLGAVDGVITAAASFVSLALAGVSAVAVLSHAHDTATACAALVDDTVSAAPEVSGLSPTVASAIEAVADAVAADGGGAAPAQLAAAVVAIGAPIAAAGVTAAPSAISPAAGYVAPAKPISARRAVTLLRAVAGELADVETLNTPAASVALAMRVGLVAEAVRAAADIDYESRQDATTVRAALDDELAGLAGETATFAYDDPAAGAGLWRAVGDLRAALARDLNEIIGRLPSVITVRPPAGISAWLIAQHFAGDDPRAVVAMFEDIVTRNRLRHPGVITTETIEILL